MQRNYILIILPIFMALVLCALPFASAAESYTHTFDDLSSLYINNVFFLKDAENNSSDILSISRYLSYGEKYNSISDDLYNDAVIAFMEEYELYDIVPFKVDSIVSLDPIRQDINEAIPNGSTDVIMHFECFMLCGSSAKSNPGEITYFTHNNLTNWSATHPATVNDIGSYSNFGTYTKTTYDQWKNRLWKISFDFSTRTGFSFLASTVNFEADDIKLYTYDPVLKVTYNNDFGVGETADDIAALDENLRQTIDQQTAAITSSLSAQTISINNSISNMEQKIAEGQDDIIDSIADMYSGLSQDNREIIGYITQTVTMPDSNITYSDYIDNKANLVSNDLQDMQIFEDALNDYLDKSGLSPLRNWANEAFDTAPQGFYFWRFVFDELTSYTVVEYLIYCSFFVTFFSLLFSVGVPFVKKLSSMKVGRQDK